MAVYTHTSEDKCRFTGNLIFLDCTLYFLCHEKTLHYWPFLYFTATVTKCHDKQKNRNGSELLYPFPSSLKVHFWWYEVCGTSWPLILINTKDISEGGFFLCDAPFPIKPAFADHTAPQITWGFGCCHIRSSAAIYYWPFASHNYPQTFFSAFQRKYRSLQKYKSTLYGRGGGGSAFSGKVLEGL